MNLTWHIVAKDLRRLRLPLALWVALFFAEFAVGLRLLNGSPLSYSSFDNLQTFYWVLFALHAMIGYLLVASLIFDDPLVGTTAFWPTRPISGARLIGAKLLACVLVFGLLPILVTIPWWLYCGYGGHQVMEASLDSLVLQIIPVSVGLLIASLTGTMPRFLTWTLLSVAVLGFALVLHPKPQTTHLFFHGMEVAVDASGRTEGRFNMLYTIALAGVALVITHQFLTRRLVRSLVLLACVAGLLTVEGLWWPLSYGDRSMETRKPSAALDGRIIIQQVKNASLHIDEDPGASSGTVVFGNLEVKGAPAGFLMRYDRPTFDWHWPDGGSSRARGTLLGEEHSNEYQLQTAIPHKEPSADTWEGNAFYKQMLKIGKPKSYADTFADYPSNRLWDYYVEVPRPEGLRMLSDPPSCTLSLEGNLLRPTLTSEIPIEKGSRWEGEGEGLRIAQTQWNERAKMLEVFVVEHHAAIGDLTNRYAFSNRMNTDSTYFAINRSLGESAWPVYLTNFNFNVRIATVAIVWRDLRFVGPSNLAPGYPSLERGMWTGPSFKDWFSGATLGHVEETVTGRFSRTVTLERFPVTPDIFSKAP